MSDECECVLVVRKQWCVVKGRLNQYVSSAETLLIQQPGSNEDTAAVPHSLTNESLSPLHAASLCFLSLN